MKKYLSIGLVSMFVLIGGLFANIATAIVPSSQGPNNAGVGSNITGVGSLAWSNPSHITSVGSPYATRNITPGFNTNYLRGRNYGFSVPVGATISGIEVVVNRNGERASAMGSTYGVKDNSVYLVKDVSGSPVIQTSGQNKADSSLWPSSFATITYGSPSDLWGLSWTSTDVNSANFGAALSATATGITGKSATVDYIQINVYYYPDVTAPTSSITSPTEGTNLRQTVTITADATDTQSGVAKVEFWHSSPVPGVKIGEDTTAPYSISWDTIDPIVGASDGTHALWVDAYDNVGNHVSSGVVNVVVDNTAPEITASIDQTFEATGPSTTPTLIPATATDNIDPSPIITPSPASFSLGATVVTWTATDAAGNTATTTSNVTIIDTTAPVIVLNGNNPFDMYINTSYSSLNPSPDFSALDLVDGDLTGSVLVTGADFDSAVLGSNTITYSVTDSHENTATTTRTVNVVDRNKPIIYRIGGSPLTVEGGSTYVDPGATAIDRDGSDITSSIIVSGWDFSTMTLGLKEIYYNVTGAELGDLTGTNVADQAQRNVNVVDTTAPIILVDPGVVNVFVGAPYIDTGVSASDIVDGDLTPSIVRSGTFTDTSTPGTFTILYDVVDNAGNHATQIQRSVNVNVPDTTNPTISSVRGVEINKVEVLFDEDLQNNQEGHHPSISDFIAYDDLNKSGSYNEGDLSYEISNVGYDNKKVTITLINPLKSGDTPRLYIRPQVSSLVDLSGNYYNNGNSDDKVITDKINPVITLTGDAIINITAGDSYTDAGATCVDVVDETCTVVPSGSVDANTAGTYTITYNATDSAGNNATPVTRTVNVANRAHQGGGGYILPQGQVFGASTGGQVLGAEKFVFTKNLRLGSKGNEVFELQKFLNAAGYGPLMTDGIFGPLTKAAVIKFQLANGLVGDGVVGPLTRALLNK